MSENQKFKATDAANEFEERIIEIRRVSKVTKGGKTISFRAVSVVGNRNGKVGLGVGNAREVPQAIRKAVQNAHKNLIEVPVKKWNYSLWNSWKTGFIGRSSIPCWTWYRGVIASSAVRAVVELAGINNILTKSIGSTNTINLAKATYNGLKELKSPKEIADLRDVSLKQVFTVHIRRFDKMANLKIKLVRGRAGKKTKDN